MLVEQRHADRRIRVQHLLGGNDLDLVGIDIEPQFVPRHLLAGVADPLQRAEVPVRSLKQQLVRRGHDAFLSCWLRRWKRSWNTGKISLRSLTLRIDSGAPLARRPS